MKIGQVISVESSMTKMTATLMPMAVGRLFDTPRKGQMPRNFERTKLSTRIDVNRMTSIIFIRRHLPSGRGRTLRTRAPRGVSTLLTVIGVGWLAACLVLNATVPPRYPGGDLRRVADAARSMVHGKAHAVILVEGTARWPWAYGEDPNVTLLFGQGFNTGYAPVSGTAGVVIMPASSAETAFSASWAPEHVRDASTLVTVAYDFPGLPEPELIADALRKACWASGAPRKITTYTVTPWHRRAGCTTPAAS